MPNVIKVKRSSTAGLVPSSLSAGELAANTADSVIYVGTGSGVTAIRPRVSATDRVLGRSSAGAGPAEELTCTAAGRSIIAAADAAGQRSVLALGAMATSSGVTLTGDVTGSGTGSFAATLSNSGVTAGTYRSVTVDAKGRVTGGTNPTTLAGYGITDAVTAGGSGASGTWAISITGSAAQLGGVAASNYFRVDGSYANADMNVPVEGYWHVASNAANLPDGALYGHRWDYDHAGDGNWVAQFYTPTSGDAGMWFRQRRFGTWQAWRKFLDSTTYNSYSPTLTGGGASGTWGISVTGTAGSETLATVCSRGVNASGYGPTFNTVYTANWFRSTGASGWFSETYGGGIWMSDSTYVRVYNNKQLYADNAISSGTALYAPIFYDSNDASWYCDPSGISRLHSVRATEVIVLGTELYVGDGTNYSNIRMRDADEGERIIHCNSNRIGFLTQAGGWGSWSNDDGSWESVGRVTATEFYESGYGGRIFGAKAWCNHSGGTSPLVFTDGGGNISSIGYRSATGRYRANFTTGITSHAAAFIGTAYSGGDSASATMVRFSTRNVVNNRTTYIDYAVSVGGAYSNGLDVMFVVVG